MNSTLVNQIVEAVLYEGHVLHPSGLLSQVARSDRLTIGCLYPETYSRHHNWTQPCCMQTQCLVEVAEDPASLQVSVCFLHPMIREVGFMEAGVSSASGEAPILRVVPELRIGEERFQTGLEAVERRVEVPSIRLDPAKPLKHEIRFQFPKNRTLQPIVREEMVVGLIRRRQEAVRGTIEITADPVGPRLLRVTIRVLNHTWVPPINPDEADPVLLQTLASTHAILHVQGGDFVSLVAPAPQHRHATRLCRNIGTWPVLVGSPSLHERDTLLSSPVMLYDYPTIATEYPPLPFSVSTSQGTACNLPDHQGENQPRRVPPLRSVSASRGRCRIEGKDGRRKFGPDNNGRSL